MAGCDASGGVDALSGVLFVLRDEVPDDLRPAEEVNSKEISEECGFVGS